MTTGSRASLLGLPSELRLRILELAVECDEPTVTVVGTATGDIIHSVQLGGALQLKLVCRVLHGDILYKPPGIARTSFKFVDCLRTDIETWLSSFSDARARHIRKFSIDTWGGCGATARRPNGHLDYCAAAKDDECNEYCLPERVEGESQLQDWWGLCPRSIVLDVDVLDEFIARYPRPPRTQPLFGPPQPEESAKDILLVHIDDQISLCDWELLSDTCVDYTLEKVRPAMSPSMSTEGKFVVSSTLLTTLLDALQTDETGWVNRAWESRAGVVQEMRRDPEAWSFGLPAGLQIKLFELVIDNKVRNASDFYPVHGTVFTEHQRSRTRGADLEELVSGCLYYKERTMRSANRRVQPRDATSGNIEHFLDGIGKHEVEQLRKLVVQLWVGCKKTSEHADFPWVLMRSGSKVVESGDAESGFKSAIEVLVITTVTLMVILVHASPTPQMKTKVARTAEHILDFKKTSFMPASSRHLLAQRAAAATTPLLLAAEGLGYAIDITFGSEDFTVLFDTGSSDLWLPTADFECLDEFGFPEDTDECALGPGFDGTLSGGTISDQNFNITYGDGEFLIGTLGYEDVTVAGVTVENQEVGLVDYGYWFGDGEVSGLIGFGYPLLTSAYYGKDPSTDNYNLTSVHYSPFFTSAFQQGLIDPVFSLAVERSAATDGPGGQLALGGLPTVDFDPTFVSVPLEIKQLGRNPAAATQFSYYTVCPDGFSYTPANATNTSSTSSSHFLGLHNFRGVGTRDNSDFLTPYVPVIVDSGTTLNYLPQDVTRAINRAFSPPSYYSNLYGLWINRCSAIPPAFAVRVAGQDLPVNPLDMLITPGGDDPSTRDFCISGIQESSNIFILGDVFLKNVIAVFDVGASELRLASRPEY